MSSWSLDDDGSDDESSVEETAAPRTGGGERFPDQARRAYITLLNTRFISRARHRVAWDGLIAWENEIRARLDEMYLDLEIDHDAQVAFKRQQDREDIPRLLRREKPLSRDTSFVLLFLRRECAFLDPADGPAVVTREQIGEFLRAFRQDGDLNDARFTRRVNAAIQALVKPLQLLTPDPDADYLFTISPVVTSLVGADEIQRLEAAFRDAADAASGQDTDSTDQGDLDNPEDTDVREDADDADDTGGEDPTS